MSKLQIIIYSRAKSQVSGAAGGGTYSSSDSPYNPGNGKPFIQPEKEIICIRGRI